MVKKKSQKKKVEKKEEPKKLDSLKINYWMIASVVLVIVLSVVLISNSVDGISKKTAEKKFITFAQSRGADVEIIEINDVGNLYEILFEFSGRADLFYISKDGKYAGYMFELEPKSTQTEQPSTYSTEDEAKLFEFNTCLADAGVKVYGANWCGYTKQWVETLGGYRAISPIYVECTESEALCQSEGISGYPTTKINGQAYKGDRTLEDIAQITGCRLPQLTGSVPTSQEASC